jgi:hypothetical protein
MIEIITKNGTVEMSLEEFSRWMCLLEAFHFIEKKAVELSVNYMDMIKPLAIEKYIEERYHSMLHDVTIDYSLGAI